MEWTDEILEEYIKKGCIFIPGNVPSSKNSRIWTGKMSIASKSVQKWKKNTKTYWEKERKNFTKQLKNLEKPYFIGCYFIKSTSHKWDFINPCQTIQDEAVKYGWFEDDNIQEMLPIPFSINNTWYGVSKKYQGVLIKVFKKYEICL